MGRLLYVVFDSSLMTEAVRTSETSVDNHFTRQYNPEDNSEHHTRRRENLKSHIAHVSGRRIQGSYLSTETQNNSWLLLALWVLITQKEQWDNIRNNIFPGTCPQSHSRLSAKNAWTTSRILFATNYGAAELYSGRCCSPELWTCR
jgi:hypothetical protein